LPDGPNASNVSIVAPPIKGDANKLTDPWVFIVDADQPHGATT
jgi:hypothetical protein